MAEGSGRSMAPPQLAIQAKEDSTASNPAIGHAGAHPSNVAPREPIRGMLDYGPALTGPVAVQGARDRHAISETDVNQGAIGNCYFLAALSSLAQQQPELLRNAISGPKADGTYDVTLYEGGNYDDTPLVRRTINVSTNFVVYGAGYTLGGEFRAQDDVGQIAYTNGSDVGAEGEELWVKLIEKAYAVMMGNWSNTDGGWEVQAFEALTGQQYTEFNYNGPFNYVRENGTELNPMSNEQLRETVIRALESGQGIGCETYDNLAEAATMFPEDGFKFFPLHAYSIVDADNLTVTVRDPAWQKSGLSRANRTITWQQFRAIFKTFTTRVE